jgi:hypothetical protein
MLQGWPHHRRALQAHQLDGQHLHYPGPAGAGPKQRAVDPWRERGEGIAVVAQPPPIESCPLQPLPVHAPSEPATRALPLQAIILRYAPIVGPIIGSAFIIGLYMAARLVRGDLTDRMKMMNQDEDKKKRTALKEARIAFLEEEVPALVAKGAKLGERGREEGKGSRG